MCVGFPLFFYAGRQKTKSFVFRFHSQTILFCCHCLGVGFFFALLLTVSGFALVGF
jgi:hypothetical protein